MKILMIISIAAAFAVCGPCFAQSGNGPARESTGTLEAEEMSIADSLPAPAPEPSEAEEIEDEDIVDEDA